MHEARAQWDTASFSLFATLNALFLCHISWWGEQLQWNRDSRQDRRSWNRGWCHWFTFGKCVADTAVFPVGLDVAKSQETFTLPASSLMKFLSVESDWRGILEPQLSSGFLLETTFPVLSRNCFRPSPAVKLPGLSWESFWCQTSLRKAWRHLCMRVAACVIWDLDLCRGPFEILLNAGALRFLYCSCSPQYPSLWVSFEMLRSRNPDATSFILILGPTEILTWRVSSTSVGPLRFKKKDPQLG